MKDNLSKHLIFYDGTCGLCHRAVQFVLKRDCYQRFVFAPLQGETAAALLGKSKASSMETLVLVENYQNPECRCILTHGQGALRISWLLGGFWVIPGVFSFLPPFLYDWLYHWVARHRFKWFGKETCLLPQTKCNERFLP